MILNRRNKNDKINHLDAIKARIMEQMIWQTDHLKAIKYAMTECAKALSADRVLVFEPSQSFLLWKTTHQYVREGVRPIPDSQNNIYIESIVRPTVDQVIGTYSGKCVNHTEPHLRRLLLERDSRYCIFIIPQNIEMQVICSVSFEFLDENTKISYLEEHFAETIAKLISSKIMHIRNFKSNIIEECIMSSSSIFALDNTPFYHLEHILVKLTQTIGLSGTAVYLTNENKSDFDCISFHTEASHNPGIFDNTINHIKTIVDFDKLLLSGYLIVELDTLKITKKNVLKSGTILLTPIIISGEYKGIIAFTDIQPHIWHETDINYLTFFTRMLSFSIQNHEQILNLKERETINLSIVNSTDDLIVMMDYNGRIRAANQAFLNAIEKRTAISDPIGIDLFSLFDDNNIFNFDEFLAIMYNKKEAVHIAYVHEGRTLNITIRNLLDDNGVPYAATLFIHDSTREKELEEKAQVLLEKAKKANSAKNEFLANMSHEILTPLNAITGYTYLLKQTKLSEKQKQYTENIEFSSSNLLALINEILDYSKIENGKVKIRYENVNIRDMIIKFKGVFLPQALLKDLSFSLEISKNVPEILYIDSYHISQILSNIISNAIKYTDEGSVSVNVFMDAADLCFSIKDTGIGISESNLELIYNKFERCDIQERTQKPGNGLGLAIVKGLCDAMGGDITVQSEVGVGSVFVVRIPLTIPEVSVSTVETKDWKNEHNHILVVDDHEMNVNICEMILKSFGLTVETALSGFAAISKCKVYDFDLILMDHMMPELDGIQTTEILRQKGFTMPIIAITANPLDEYKELYLKSGMNDMLEKPISVAKLETVLSKYLNN